jgi:hypothetical protein
MTIVRAAYASVLAAAVGLLALLGAPAPAAHAQTGGPEHSGVVLVGVPGLAWTDISREDMPTVHNLAGENAAASLTVRTIRSRTCTVDGWLTLGAGKRAIDQEDTTGDGEGDRFCREVPEPEPAGGSSVVVPDWEELDEVQADRAYGTEIGLLGSRLAEAGVCATAVGPGAALALADRSGTVGSYLPDPSALTRDTIADCPVTVVDLGGLPMRLPPDEADDDSLLVDERRAAAAEIDQAIAALATIIPDDVAFLIAGVADSAPAPIPAADEPLLIAPSGLRVALASGPMPSGDPYGQNWLSSRSTRWDGVVQLTDIAATLAYHAGLDDPIDEGTMRVDAKMPIDEVNELLPADITSSDELDDLFSTFGSAGPG